MSFRRIDSEIASWAVVAGDDPEATLQYGALRVDVLMKLFLTQEDISTAGTFEAYSALFERIRGINGATGGYHTNLEDRVYKKLWLPEEKQIKLPYAALPILDPSATVLEHEEPIIASAWRQPIFIFVPETASSEFQGVAVENALKAYDDVVKALMVDWHFR